mmetsp:Transcript_5909/g.9174  ORF Transcript_5909/g.9174 Transcript_5909/m.9174 type:complete len:323 (-) Transcript_5909:246-1214(-)
MSVELEQFPQQKKTSSLSTSSILEEQWEDGHSARSFCRMILGFIRYYWGDYILILGLATAGGLPQKLVEPRHFKWALTDPNYHSPPQDDEQVPEIAMSLSYALGPFVIFFVYELINSFFFSRAFNFRRLHHLAVGWALMFCFVEILQGGLSILSGGLRSDFYHRCQPILPWQPGTDIICTGDEDEIENGRRGFPSGHASFVCGSGMFVSLFFIGVLQPFDGKSYVYKHVCWATPIIGGLFISITRWTDAKHTFSAVVVGVLVGIACGLLGYFNYFPSFRSPGAGLPLCVRDAVGMPKSVLEKLPMGIIDQPHDSIKRQVEFV